MEKLFRPAFVLLALVVTIGSAACYFLFHQNLNIRQTSEGVLVDVRNLGEYSTSVRKLNLTELESGAVVWELRAQDNCFPLWGIGLRSGENPAFFDGLRNAVVVIPTTPTFSLSKGKRYRIDLWTYQETIPRHVSEEFTIE